MIIKISDKQLWAIAKEVSQEYIKKYFDTNREYIYGDEIIEFAPHKQVNLFILFQIFSDWNTIVNTLRHPYFDFEHSEVQESVKALKNVLSRHIRINRSHMLKMTEKAVINNMRLILDPINTYVNFFFPNKNSITLEALDKYSPYFEDFGFMLHSIITFMKKNNIEKITKDEYVVNANKIIKLYEKKTGNSIKVYQAERFKDLTGKDLGDLLSGSPSVTVNKVGTDSTQELLLRKLLGTNISDNVEEIPGEDKKITNPLLSAIHYVKKGKIGEQFSSGEGVNDAFKGLRVEQIPLHKQFNFTQNLFKGDNLLFKKTLDEINKLNSYEEALTYLRENIFKETRPDPEDAVLTEFLDLLKQHFN